jgi:hypothetical protein
VAQFIEVGGGATPNSINSDAFFTGNPRIVIGPQDTRSGIYHRRQINHKYPKKVNSMLARIPLTKGVFQWRGLPIFKPKGYEQYPKGLSGEDPTHQTVPPALSSPH